VFTACSLIWGSTFLFIAVGNDALPPLWAASLRLMLATVILTGLTYATGQRLPRGRAWVAAAQYGVLNMGLSFCLLYWGEQTVPSGLTAVLYATIPLSTALLARAFGLEPLRPFKVFAALVALGGVALMFSGSAGGAFSPGHLAAILVAATLASASGVMLKRGPRQHALGANAVGTLVGLAVCLPASFLLGERHPLPVTAAALGPVIYLTLAGSVGAFVLYAWLVNHWPVTRISFISVIVPVVALLLGILVRGERLTAGSGLGSLLVFAGLGLALAGDRFAWKNRGG
jgi:drug/metabolite transporter (DMT)-like permease